MVIFSAISALTLALFASATAVDVTPRREDLYWEVEAYSDGNCQNKVYSSSGFNTVVCNSFGATPVNSIKLKGHNFMFGSAQGRQGNQCTGYNDNNYPDEGVCQKLIDPKRGYYVYYQA